MHLLMLVAGVLLASVAHAQGLAGTFAIQGPDGPIVVRIQVSGRGSPGRSRRRAPAPSRFWAT
jgi:hypothetical protein